MVPVQTVIREGMLYRNYTLHPNVDDYFYYNYKNFTSYPLVQQTTFIENHSEEHPGTRPLLFTLNGICSVNFDIFIKLGSLKTTSLRKIYVRYEGMPSANSFYRMDWLTIYLYNVRTFPTLVKHNIFVLPNLVLFASSTQKYILELYFDYKELNRHSFTPWRKSVSECLPYDQDVKSVIMDCLPNHIDVDMWHRANMNEQTMAGYNTMAHIINMLRMAHRNAYMSSYLIPIRNGCATLNLHKNLLKADSIFAIMQKNKGAWNTVLGFNRMQISSAQHNIVVNDHDMYINNVLNAYHVKKNSGHKQQYSIPLKFKLTSQITSPIPKECSLPIYYMNFIDLLGQHLTMGEDADADANSDYIQLDFYTTTTLQNRTNYRADDKPTTEDAANRDHIYYLYLELSM